jgi:hypothetical protein
LPTEGSIPQKAASCTADAPSRPAKVCWREDNDAESPFALLVLFSCATWLALNTGRSRGSGSARQFLFPDFRLTQPKLSVFALQNHLLAAESCHYSVASNCIQLKQYSVERKTTARSISGMSQKDRRCPFGAMVKF